MLKGLESLPRAVGGAKRGGEGPGAGRGGGGGSRAGMAKNVRRGEKRLNLQEYVKVALYGLNSRGYLAHPRDTKPSVAWLHVAHIVCRQRDQLKRLRSLLVLGMHRLVPPCLIQLNEMRRFARARHIDIASDAYSGNAFKLGVTLDVR